MKRIVLYVNKAFKYVWNGYADAFASKHLREIRHYATKGNIDAIKTLAEMSETGTRVLKKDVTKAYSFYTILVEKKVAIASDKIRELESMMSDAEIAEAKQFVLDWRETYGV